MNQINRRFANLHLHHRAARLTWDSDLNDVGGSRPCLVGDAADIVTGVILRDAAEEQSLVQDVDIVGCGLV